MLLHKLVQVTITIKGLPEYTGTDDELQELTEDVELLLHTGILRERIKAECIKVYPDLIDKIIITVRKTD